MKLPISALIVGFQEGDLLYNCLNSIQFCDEIIYVDLGSTDNSIQIAEKFKCKIYYHGHRELKEIIVAKYTPNLKNDWVVSSC